MAEPVYNSFRARPTEAWYQLSKAEQDSLIQKIDETGKQVGCKAIVLCRSRWSNEQWLFFGVHEYPDIEALQKHVELLEALDWYRYVQGDTMVGVRWQA